MRTWHFCTATILLSQVLVKPVFSVYFIMSWLIHGSASPHKALEHVTQLPLSPAPSLSVPPLQQRSLPGSSDVWPCPVRSYLKAFALALPSFRIFSSLTSVWHTSLFHSWVCSNITWSEKSVQTILSKYITLLLHPFSQLYFLHRLITHMLWHCILIDLNIAYLFIEGRNFISVPQVLGKCLAYRKLLINIWSERMLNLLIYCFIFIVCTISSPPPKLISTLVFI